MAREFSRTQRVADYLKRELASLIQLELADPRLGMISITDVEVSRDLAHARVHVTVLGRDSAEEAAETVTALNNAAGHLRSLIARQMRARTIPRLKFFYDSSIARGAYMHALIERAVAEDEERRRRDENRPGSRDAEQGGQSS